MAYTTIDKPTDYFNTKLYTGNGSTNAITGVGFQPDWVWIKRRNGSGYHILTDAVRGVNSQLYSNDSTAEGTLTNNIQSFDSDGFTLGTNSDVNGSSDTYASWNWLASNTTASNTDGSITSTVSANTTSGFSIVSYTGTGSNATVGHGLGVAPSVIIVKNRSSVGGWPVYHKGVASDPETDYLLLHSTDAVADNNIIWNDTAPTSTVFSIGTGSSVNTNTNNHIAYCFAEKKGFSKFGSYTGNGSNDGTFVYLGFKPAFVIVKRTDAVQSWYLLDNKRNTFNPEDKYFKVDASSAEDTLSFFDFVSNGFKARGTGIGFNSSGGSFIYMAFAESPFVTSSGIPTVAR
jgi:hypothetical protein